MNVWWVLVPIYFVGLLFGVAGTLCSTAYTESEYSADDGVGPFASLYIMVWPIVLGIYIAIYVFKKLVTDKTVKANEEHQVL